MRLIFTSFLFIVLSSCGTPPEKREYPTINLETREEGSTTVADYNVTASKAQIISTSSKVFVVLAPGSLGIDAKLIIGDGEELSDSSLTKVANSVLIVAEGNGDLSILKPMTISLPLPFNTGDAPQGTLLVAYNGLTSDGFKKGIIASENLSVSSNLVTFKANFWGSYQLVTAK